MRSHRESNKQVSLEEEARGAPALLPTRIAFGGFLGWAERQLTAENGGGRREVGEGKGEICHCWRLCQQLSVLCGSRQDSALALPLGDPNPAPQPHPTPN